MGFPIISILIPSERIFFKRNIEPLGILASGSAVKENLETSLYSTFHLLAALKVKTTYSHMHRPWYRKALSTCLSAVLSGTKVYASDPRTGFGVRNSWVPVLAVILRACVGLSELLLSGSVSPSVQRNNTYYRYRSSEVCCKDELFNVCKGGVKLKTVVLFSLVCSCIILTNRTKRIDSTKRFLR